MKEMALACLMAAVVLVPRGADAASAVEIVTVGSEPARGEMEAALRSLLAMDARLSWVAEDAAAASVTSQTDSPPRIWIDVAIPGEVRIVVPGRGRNHNVSVRTVVADDTAEAGAPAVRETVAQIVGETVRALRAEEEETPPPLPVAAVPVSAAVAQSVSVSPAMKPRRFEAILAGGVHTAPFKMAEPASESNWLGAAVQAQLRWRIGKAAVAMRAAWEKTDKTIDDLWLHTQFFRMSLAVFRRAQVETVGLAIGWELGALYLRQSTEVNSSYIHNSQREFPPGTLGDTQSLGWFFGPIAEANFELADRWFFHVDFAVTIDNLKVQAGTVSAKTEWAASPSVRGMLGLGVRI